ncbi:MAG: tRNA (adenosine(37)-N6)-dimethylallyltransferase MiaA [Bacteroidales bacterium]|nr:tRNA (adenosine(37)-N6)-dimethylallyltransferase MiaA [Bacteroidales bacterium]
MDVKNKLLVIIQGATGIGKTDTTIDLAIHFGSEIISCDSRQFYKELNIGTATPTHEQLGAVPHHLIGHISITDNYNSYQFEQDSLLILNKLFEHKEVVFMTGGSGLYIDAVCNGIDLIPDINEDIRTALNNKFIEEGLDSLQTELKIIDPEYYSIVDLKNQKRLIRAIEVYQQTGKPYSHFRSNAQKKRDFTILKISLERPREELYQRINQRVIQMIDSGLENEARSLIAYRELNALNTVGYKEMFEYIEGKITLDKAIELIQRNSRHYAKKQISWFKRDLHSTWLHPSDIEGIMKSIKTLLQ